MKKIYSSLFLVALCGIMNGQLVTAIKVNGPCANLYPKLPLIDYNLKFTAGITPSNAANKNVVWSVSQGSDVIALVDSTLGLFKTLKGGICKVMAKSLDGSNITGETEYTVFDTATPVRKGYFLNFNDQTPMDLFSPEHADDYILKTDSNKHYMISPQPAVVPDSLIWFPVYRMTPTSQSIRIDIDKAGPFTAAGPILTWKGSSYGFSALRLSFCPGANTLLDMSSIKKVNIKLKSSADITFQAGWCSPNTAGNPGQVNKMIIQDTTHWTVYQLDFTNKSMLDKIDSTMISHMFMNFNPGQLLNWQGKWQPQYNFKGTVEIQYMAFGEMANIIPAERVIISGDNIVPVNKTATYDFVISPDNSSNQDYVYWSTSDNSIATIDGSGKLSPKKEGTVKLFAQSADIDNGFAAAATGEYTVKIVASDGLSTQKTDFFVYPNPVAERLQIGGAAELVSAEIVSITGAVVKSILNTGAMKLNVDVTSLPAGVYFVKCYSQNGEVVIKKFVKE